jgi:parvulin-like peptidyl-prolyl isomerase
MARRSSLALLALVALLAFGAAACCGGDDSVPADAVAVVDGETIPTSTYNSLLAQAKRTFQQQKRDFPKAGTAERKQLTDEAVKYLVQREQFEQQAADRNLKITDADVEKQLKQIKQQYFGGDEKKYATQLKQQGLTDAQVRSDVRAQIVSQKLFDSVTKDVKVTDADVKSYYEKNKAQFGTPEQRDVRHILVKTKAQADKIYGQLKAGGNFAALAKQFSQDPGSKDNGGKLTISKGQTVAPFDQTAFLLPVNQISRPVKTEYGYHIIQPVSAVKDATTKPLDKALRDQIREQLLSKKREAAMNTWIKDLPNEYDGKVSYAEGFAPSTSNGSGTTTGETN